MRPDADGASTIDQIVTDEDRDTQMFSRNNNKGRNRRADHRPSGDSRWRRLVRWVRDLAPTVLLCAIALGLPYVVYQGYLTTVSSPYFALETIEVEGAEHASRASLLVHAEIAPGVNIFDVDAEAVTRRLREHPWVAQAEVHTSLPDTLAIHVTEHAPRAIVLDAGVYWLVDARGRPFKRMDATDDLDALLDRLPLVTGPTHARLNAEDASARERLDEALGVWQMWEETGLSDLAAPTHVHVDPVLGVSLIVGDDAVEVRLGWGRWEERLARYRAVHEELQRRGVQPEYILIDQREDIDRVAVGPAQAKDEAL